LLLILLFDSDSKMQPSDVVRWEQGAGRARGGGKRKRRGRGRRMGRGAPLRGRRFLAVHGFGVSRWPSCSGRYVTSANEFVLT